MSVSKEMAYKKAKAALEKAQKNYDKAYEAWQNELDLIVLKPIHVRNISRKEAVMLAGILNSDDCFKKIMEMGALPEQLMKTSKGENIQNESSKFN